MASSTQLKALIKSHIAGDDEQFYSIALQVAAAEARRGHSTAATDLRDLVDQGRAEKSAVQKNKGVVPIARPRGELSSLLSVSYPKSRLNELVRDADIDRKIRRLLAEQTNADKLGAYGKSPRNKLLLIGPGGGTTGDLAPESE
jgi:hypothetical protein